MKKESFASALKVNYNNLEDNVKYRIRNAFYKENYTKLRFSALFMLICQILFTVRDSLAGFFLLDKLNYINLGTEITMIITSSLFLLFSNGNSKEWSDDRKSRIIYRIYFILLTLSVCAYIFTDMYVRHTAFGVCICFLLVPILVPFYDILSQSFLFGFVAVFSSAVFLFEFPEDPLGVIGVFIMHALLFITSCFLRSYFIKILIYREKAQNLTDELIYRNKTDFLTDVSNRFCLYDDYDTAKKNGTSVGIVLYDVDDFKKYNDLFSHISGDKCLIKTSRAVKDFAKTKNGKVYRFGGEEFVVMFFGIDKEAFYSLVPEINNVIYDLKIRHSDEALHPFISASVGASYSFDSSEPIESILLKCDEALYKAKSNGKNCFMID